MDNNLLNAEIQQNQRKIHPDSYPQSIGEITGIYQRGELILRPDFQRYFRWDSEKKSKLIESIFLGLPLPSFFVFTNERSEWELVDGLQRISTILEFMGELRDEHKKFMNSDNSIENGLTVNENFKYLKSLGGATWQDIPNNLKIEFKRFKLNFNILKVGTDKEVKYELFQRLNTGGASLSNQEVRNCIMIMENKVFFEFIEKISENTDFQNTISSLSDKESTTQYDKELILRFFALRHAQKIIKITSVNKFIEESMFSFFENFEYLHEEKIFNNTFTFLNSVFGEDVFKRFYASEGKFKRKMVVPFFDIITLWTSRNLPSLLGKEENVRSLIKKIWTDDNFNDAIGVGPRIEAKLSYALNGGQDLIDSIAKEYDI